jgi:hypothetical protein
MPDVGSHEPQDNTLEDERRSVQRKLETAREELDSARREVNRILVERVATRRWYDNLPRLALTDKPSQIREAVTYGSKLAALNMAEAAATAALKACEEVVEGLQRALETLPSR